MGVITISLDNETEKKLREIAKQKYGNKKGAMSMVIKNSLELVAKKRLEESPGERLLRMAKSGLTRGKSKEKFDLRKFREEIYNERIDSFGH